jgi:hypothetical protein
MARRSQNSKNHHEEIKDSAPALTEESATPEEHQSENTEPPEETVETDEAVATDDAALLPEILAESVAQQESAPSSELPAKLKMLKNFRIEMPLPGRSDAFISLVLKKDQEITDTRIIKHLLKSDAPFTLN